MNSKIINTRQLDREINQLERRLAKLLRLRELIKECGHPTYIELATAGALAVERENLAWADDEIRELETQLHDCQQQLEARERRRNEH